MSDWKVISPYCIEHKETGNRVNKVSNSFEVWYKVAGSYKHGGVSDKETAMREAAKK